MTITETSDRQRHPTDDYCPRSHREITINTIIMCETGKWPSQNTHFGAGETFLVTSLHTRLALPAKLTTRRAFSSRRLEREGAERDMVVLEVNLIQFLPNLLVPVPTNTMRILLPRSTARLLAKTVDLIMGSWPRQSRHFNAMVLQIFGVNTVRPS